MKCKKCGAEIQQDASFCSKCGEAVKNVAEETDEVLSEMEGTLEKIELVTDEKGYKGDFMSSDIQGLSREDTMEVLERIKEIALESEGYEVEIPKVQAEVAKEKAEAESLRKKASGYAKVILCAIVFGLAFVGISAQSLILTLVFMIAGYFIADKLVVQPDLKRHAAENNAKADQYIIEKVEPLEQNLEILLQKQEELTQSGKIEWAIDIVGEDMFYSGCISDLYILIKSRRADNLKEALNKYDDEQHKLRMEQMQKAIQNSAEVTARESVKQTAAAKMTAASSYETYRNTKEISKNTRKINKKLR